MPQSQINLSSGQWFLDNADVLWQLIDVTSDAVLVIDTTQCILSVNKGAEKIFGYGAEEVLGKPYNLVPSAGEEEFSRMFNRAAAKKYSIAFGQSPSPG